MKKPIWLLCIVLSLTASAAIYRSVDSNGVVTYSDQPSPSSQEIEVSAPSISTPAAAAPNTTDSTKTTDATHVPYTLFEMKTPKDQETFQNATEATLSVDIQPPLQPGDTVQFFLDGQPVNDASTDTSIVVHKTEDNKPRLERGTHTIYAVLYNKKGEEIKTTPQITVFVHYTSVLFPNQPAGAPKP